MKYSCAIVNHENGRNGVRSRDDRGVLSAGRRRMDTRGDWNRAPELRKQDFVLLAEPERAQSVGRFYDGAGAWMRTAQSPEMRAGLSSTGRKSADPPQQKENGELEVANDLVGKELIDREHKDFGKVADLLINFSEKKPVLALVTVTQESGTDKSFL